ncbi:MAG TPA: hypothetical protein VHB77_03555 [Planctomycetaceae bacterium]|nr:hypothetical protein [Planctomycetaceae bacterium]
MSAVKNSWGGLGVERVEDRLVLTASASFVDASFIAGTLTLTGDNLNDTFSIQQVTVGQGKSAVQELEISGSRGTQLTSNNQTLTLDAHGRIFVPTSDAVTGISVMLGTGNNNVTISKLTTLAPATIAITDSGAAGNNYVRINGVSGATALTATLGTGNDSLIVGGSSLASVSATLASGVNFNDNVQLNSVNVSGTTAITTGAGIDRVALNGDPGRPHSIYTGAVTVSLGAGNDHALVNNAAFSSTLNIDGISGNDFATGYAKMNKSNLTVVNATNQIHTR